MPHFLPHDLGAGYEGSSLVLLHVGLVFCALVEAGLAAVTLVRFLPLVSTQVDLEGPGPHEGVAALGALEGALT